MAIPAAHIPINTSSMFINKHLWPALNVMTIHDENRLMIDVTIG
jgi:hypothetical protein